MKSNAKRKSPGASTTQWPAGYRHLNDVEVLRVAILVTPLENELAQRLNAAIDERSDAIEELEEHKERYCWTDEDYKLLEENRDTLDSENIRLDTENVEIRLKIEAFNKEADRIHDFYKKKLLSIQEKPDA